MAAMCEATKSGSSSPIRYPASNAGSLAGLTAIALGFRGPTLMLTLPAARGVPVGLLLAEAWLSREVVAFVAVTFCGRRDTQPAAMGGGPPYPPAQPVARTLLVTKGDGVFDRERESEWLALEGR